MAVTAPREGGESPGQLAWTPDSASLHGSGPATEEPELPPDDVHPTPPPPSTPSPLRRPGVRLSVVLVMLAALVGAASATIVVRATGWGSETVVQRNGGLPTRVIGTRSVDVPSIVRQVLPGVVSITAMSSQSMTSSGTGIVVSKSGQVVTNAHVVEGAQSIVVTLNNSEQYEATLVGMLPQRDLALLEVIGAGPLSPVRLGDSSKTVVGDEVVSIGYALGLSGGPSVTEGIISAKHREVETDTADGTPFTLREMLQSDAPISSGNSGGPLLNAAAQVIGINTIVASSSDEVTAQNVNFAISSDTLRSLLPELRAMA